MNNRNISNKEYWYEIITAYKQGELLDQQEQELFRWKAEKAEHAVFFDEVEKSWIASREKTVFPEFNIPDAWNKVRTQTIDKQRPKVISIWSQLLQAPIIRAAAAVLILGVITWAMSNVLFTKPTFTDLHSLNGMKEFYLPDSSKVYLHDTTTLRYSSTYGEDERMVFLDGEAFFEVRKDATKPFTVLSYRSRVIVKGTSFLVRSRAKDSVDIVEVEEGKVAVLEKYSRSGKEIMLTKGMACFIDIYGGLQKSAENVIRTASWRYSESMVFVGTPLIQVLADLKDKKGTQVELENKQAGACRFTGEFENSSSTEIIEIIALSMNMQVEKQGNTYVLKGGGCK